MGTGASATNVKIKSPVNNPNNKKPDRYSNINIESFTEREKTIRIINQINIKNILQIRRGRLNTSTIW